MSFSPQQSDALKAVEAWLADPNGPQVFYLAGYAGTGKTTLAKHLAADAGKVCFAAFTGKAAMVLRGKGCGNAKTIHSLIYKAEVPEGGGAPYFVLDLHDSPAASADLIVIDEVSMVGEELGRDLLKFNRKVLVLGDPAQLPPVGDSSGFFTRRTPDVMLTEIHRQAEDNPIIALATSVRRGERLKFGTYGTSLVLPRNKFTAAMAANVDQVLCGRNKTRIEKNRRMRSMMGREGRFEAGERVVALRNNSQNGLLNGSLWRVDVVEYSDELESELSISPLDDGLTAGSVEIKTHHYWLDGRDKELPMGMQRKYDPVDYGYVLSVHKAQGSQWDSVAIIDESWVFKEDAAKHLYTAITRAAERVIIAI